MPRSLHPRLLVGLLVAGASCLMAGCALKPVPPDRTRLHVTSTSPIGAVSEYLSAWELRDPERVGRILDAAYVGTSTEATSGSFSVASFTRATEIDIVSRMSRDSTIDQVLVEIPWTALRRVAGADSAGWATVQVPGGRVVVWRSAVSSLIGRWDSMEFQLKPRIPFRELPYDTLWTVVRWNEPRSAS